MNRVMEMVYVNGDETQTSTGVVRHGSCTFTALLSDRQYEAHFCEMESGDFFLTITDDKGVEMHFDFGSYDDIDTVLRGFGGTTIKKKE